MSDNIEMMRRVIADAIQPVPEKHVGDSAFEQWYQAHPKACGGDKQLARDAYAAGMADSLTPLCSFVDFDAVRGKRMSELTPAQKDDAHELWIREQLGFMTEYHIEKYEFLLKRLDESRQATETLAGALAMLRNRFDYYVEYHEASGNQAKADSNRFYVKLADAVLEAVGKGGGE